MNVIMKNIYSDKW